jgi:uncharacterized protein YbjT (DUF2867 family)
MKKTAIVIGATGLVGKQLVEKLIKDSSFEKVKIYVRSTTNFQSTKVEEFVIDFDYINNFEPTIKGDVLFSCLGTTLNQAGSKENQKLVDYTYQLEFAKIAKKNGVPNYVLISSVGSDKKSFFFYNKIKGELESAVRKLHFKKTTILQPSILSGSRKENRLGETVGATVVDAFASVLPFLKKYRSISGKQVAKAMIYYYKNANKEPFSIYKLDQLFV